MASTPRNIISINCCKDLSKTLVFNEDLDEFTGEASFVTPIFGNIYEELFTTGLQYLWQQSYMYRHEMPDYLWYYGKHYEWQLSFYENCNTAKESLSSLTKNYESQKIHSKENEFFRIDWSTEYQQGSLYPFVNEAEFWKVPEYLEHHWQVPIMVKTDADTQDYQTDSSMQGTWLKTTLRYKDTTEFYVKGVTTYYRPSYI